MRLYTHLITGSLSLASLARCMAFAGPQPTAKNEGVDKALQGWTPKPTSAPRVKELLKKTASSDSYLSGFCGWATGDYDLPISCPVGTCMFYAPQSAVVGMAACCTNSVYQSCNWVRSCVDYFEIQSSSCDSKCFANSFVRKCTDTASPFCISWTYPDAGVQDYGCNIDGASTWTTVKSVAATSSSTTTLTVPVVAAAAVTGWQSTATPTTRSTSQSAAQPGTSSTTSTSSTPTAAGNITKTSIAVIAGGAAGGTFVLCAVAGLAVFFCIRARRAKKKMKKNTNNEPQYPYNYSGMPEDKNNLQMEAYPIEAAGPPAKAELPAEDSRRVYEMGPG